MITMTYIAGMVVCLSCTPLGERLDGIMLSILLSSVVQLVGVTGQYLKIGPLAVKKNLQPIKDPVRGTTTTTMVDDAESCTSPSNE